METTKICARRGRIGRGDNDNFVPAVEGVSCPQLSDWSIFKVVFFVYWWKSRKLRAQLFFNLLFFAFDRFSTKLFIQRETRERREIERARVSGARARSSDSSSGVGVPCPPLPVSIIFSRIGRTHYLLYTFPRVVFFSVLPEFERPVGCL